MKAPKNYLASSSPLQKTTTRAFTLTELMVTMAVFALVVMAMVSLQVFGFKMNSLTSNKTESTGDSLKVLDQIRNRIRAATNEIFVGNFNLNNNTFTPIGGNTPQIGNAVQIFNNATDYFTFFREPNGIVCERATDDAAIALTRSKLINTLPFQAEDYKGNVMSNQNGHFTIKMTFEFSNLVYSVPTPTYDSFYLECRATPRIQF